jgi:hypothetical protein
VVEMSGLRHLARFVTARFNSDLSVLKTPEFQSINSNLLGKHKLQTVQQTWTNLFDRYLDNDRNQMNLFVSDIVSFVSNLNPKEQKELEEIGLKLMLVLSDERLGAENFGEISSLVEVLISQWPELSQLLSQIKGREKLLRDINSLMDNLVEDPLILKRMMNLFLKKLTTEKELKKLIQDSDFRTKILLFINLGLENSNSSSDLNWTETFRMIFASESVRWGPVREWIISSTRSTEPKLTLSLLIKVLSENTSEGPRYKLMMDELFLNHRTQLDTFLKQTFSLFL